MVKFLLAVDGSACSLRAVEQAIARRARYRHPEACEVHLVNVQAAISSDISRFLTHEQLAVYYRETSEKALQAARARADAAGITCIVHCEIGVPAEAIARLAETLSCDEIVMGSNGRSAFSEFLVGSITLKVVQLTKIPVLLVK